jgi:hypothetical protein
MDTANIPESQKEIRYVREQHLRNIQLLQMQIDQQVAVLTFLKKVCEHPDKYNYSAMGENCSRCPDCGQDW